LCSLFYYIHYSAIEIEWYKITSNISGYCYIPVELAMNSKNKIIEDLYRGINEFKKGYQPRSNFVKDETGDLLVDSLNILNRWKNYFS
jgi:hypothetical protein